MSAEHSPQDAPRLPLPWRWQDAYDFAEHIEHQAQGLDAECENIKAGRVELVDANGKGVLGQWADYAGDSGLDCSVEHMRLIVHRVNTWEQLRDALRAFVEKWDEKNATMGLPDPLMIRSARAALEAADTPLLGESGHPDSQEG